MKERPILFSAPMVRAILGGTKTQTRRIVKPWEPRPGNSVVPANVEYLPDFTCYRSSCPYGQPGDRLWVRESFSRLEAFDFFSPEVPDPVPEFWYWADGNPTWGDWTRPKPSIHMPRAACRIVLEITGVRVERLQDISEEDARAEGCAPAWLDADDNTTVHAEAKPTYRQGFARIWRDINGASSWEANPWVWVVEFRRVEA